eukprot:m51a1_g14444 hypothetical protein (105) ;mRNA; f:572433-572747
MDVNPANVFVDQQGECFLGYYGGCVRIGDAVREADTSYFPRDATHRAAEPKHDWHLLYFTLLNKLGFFDSPKQEPDVSILVPLVSALPATPKHIMEGILSLTNS